MIFLITGSMLLTTSTFLSQKENKVQQELAEEVIRFHVRANSDEDMDQKMKVKVKNAVIDYLKPFLADQENVRTARKVILDQLTQIELVAESVLNEYVTIKEDTVSVKIKKEAFPEKRYGDFVFPKGTYEAVVISIGEGKGQNWWCMLYPGLCFVDEAYAVVSEEGGERLEEVLSEDTFAWIYKPERRKIGFRWLNFR